MKQWLIIIVLLLALFAGGFFLAVKLIMPKAAVTFIPAKWQNVPLRQHRNVVLHYFGEPDSTAGNTDIWKHKLSKAKQYSIVIDYDTASVARKYIINYEVVVLGYRSTTEIITDSVR